MNSIVATETSEAKLLGELSDFMRAVPEKAFRPVAYYDKHLDCIRVQIIDCSFTEKRMNQYITILYANHQERGSPAGFNIKGVRSLFDTLGLDTNRVYKLTELIDHIIKFYPDASIQQIKSIFTPVLQQESLEVRVEFAAA